MKGGRSSEEAAGTERERGSREREKEKDKEASEGRKGRLGRV